MKRKENTEYVVMERERETTPLSLYRNKFISGGPSLQETTVVRNDAVPKMPTAEQRMNM